MNDICDVDIKIHILTNMLTCQPSAKFDIVDFVRQEANALKRKMQKEFDSRMKKEEKKRIKYEKEPHKLYGRISTLRSEFWKDQAPPQHYAQALSLWHIYIKLVGCVTQCMYCGTDVAFEPFGSDGDHFNSTIVDKRSRGYSNDLFNRVPCCSKCNSSKSKKDPVEFMLWTKWILELPGYEKRLARVKRFRDEGETYRIKYDVESPAMVCLFETLEQTDFFFNVSIRIQADVASQLRTINETVPRACKERSARVNQVIAYVRQLF